MLFARTVPFLSAALILGGAAGASAADLGSPDLNTAPTMAPMPAFTYKWYLRADGGYTWYPTPDMSFSDFDNHYTKSEGAWSVGGGFGQYYAWGFRGDITVDHMFDATNESQLRFRFDEARLQQHGRSRQPLLRIQSGRTFRSLYRRRLGYAHNETSFGNGRRRRCRVVIRRESRTDNFAAAAMAGVSWRLWGGRTM